MHGHVKILAHLINSRAHVIFDKMEHCFVIQTEGYIMM